MKRYLLAAVLLGIVVGSIVVYMLIVRPANVEAVGEGTPEITSQFSDIKTRAKTSTPVSNNAIQYVVYVRPEHNRLPAQQTLTPDRFYESCTLERSSTATPTPGSTITPVSTRTPRPTETANVNIAEPDFIVLNIVGSESEACYQVGEILFERNNLFVVAVGVTKAINGEIAIDRANVANSRVGDIVIDISQLRSDERSRDGAIREEWLESNKYPLARLIEAQMVGLPSRPYRDGEVLKFQIVGKLEVREVPNEVTFDVSASLIGDTLVGTASANIKMTDFGFSPPNLIGGLRANNEVRIVLNFVAREPKATEAATPTPISTVKMDATLQSLVATVPRSCAQTPRYGAENPHPDVPVRDKVGTGFVLKGIIRSRNDCKPIAGAIVTYWLTNPEGQYDADHEGKVLTDQNGLFRIESNFPGQYESTRPHIHIYIEADGHRSVETEYLPSEGDSDGVIEIVLAPPLPPSRTDQP